MDALLSEKNAHPAHIFVHFPEGEDLFLFDHVGDPDEGLLVGLGVEVAIDHVVVDVDESICEPSVEGGVGGIENGFGEAEPVNVGGFFLPEEFAGFGGGCPPVGLSINGLISLIHGVLKLDKIEIS